MLREKAINKINHVFKLKTITFASIKREGATKEEIVDYLKQIQKYENVDLDAESDVAKQKLSLLRLVNRCLEGKLKNNNEAGGEPQNKPQRGRAAAAQAQGDFNNQPALPAEEAAMLKEDIIHLRAILEIQSQEDIKNKKNQAANAEINNFAAT